MYNGRGCKITVLSNKINERSRSQSRSSGVGINFGCQANNFDSRHEADGGTPRFILNCFNVRVGLSALGTGVANVVVAKTKVMSRRMNICLCMITLVIGKEVLKGGEVCDIYLSGVTSCTKRRIKVLCLVVWDEVIEQRDDLVAIAPSRSGSP